MSNAKKIKVEEIPGFLFKHEGEAIALNLMINKIETAINKAKGQ